MYTDRYPTVELRLSIFKWFIAFPHFCPGNSWLLGNCWLLSACLALTPVLDWPGDSCCSFALVPLPEMNYCSFLTSSFCVLLQSISSAPWSQHLPWFFEFWLITVLPQSRNAWASKSPAEPLAIAAQWISSESPLSHWGTNQSILRYLLQWYKPWKELWVMHEYPVPNIQQRHIKWSPYFPGTVLSFVWDFRKKKWLITQNFQTLTSFFL